MAEHDLKADALPRLNEAQMAVLGRCPLTRLERYRGGEKLFEVGVDDCHLFVVKSGAVEIVDESAETPKTVTVLGPGEFTGDEAQLTSGPSPVSGVARSDGEVDEVSSDALRQILNLHPELGDPGSVRSPNNAGSLTVGRHVGEHGETIGDGPNVADHRRGEAAPGRGGVRPGLRGAAAEAGHPAAAGQRAGDGLAGGPDQRR